MGGTGGDALIGEVAARPVAIDDVELLGIARAQQGAQVMVQRRVRAVDRGADELLAERRLDQPPRSGDRAQRRVVPSRRRSQLRQRRGEDPVEAAEAADQPLGQLLRLGAGEGGEKLRHDR